jgi:hypothetical protein
VIGFESCTGCCGCMLTAFERVLSHVQSAKGGEQSVWSGMGWCSLDVHLWSSSRHRCTCDDEGGGAAAGCGMVGSGECIVTACCVSVLQ